MSEMCECVQMYASECAKVCKSVREGCARVRGSVHKCARVCKSVAKVCKSAANVLWDLRLTEQGGSTHGEETR